MPRPLRHPVEIKAHISDAQHMALRWQADALGISVAALVRGLIEQHLNNTEKEAV